MLKKLSISIIYICLLTFNVSAGSDGELALKKDQPQKIKDCFEKLNRATFAFNPTAFAIVNICSFQFL